MHQEKKEETRLASIENCVKATVERLEEYTKEAKKHYLQQLITAMSTEITLGQTRKQQNLEKQKRKKNNCMDTSSDKIKKCPVSSGGRIHPLHLCKRVRLPQRVS